MPYLPSKLIARDFPNRKDGCLSLPPSAKQQQKLEDTEELLSCFRFWCVKTVQLDTQLNSRGPCSRQHVDGKAARAGLLGNIRETRALFTTSSQSCSHLIIVQQQSYILDLYVDILSTTTDLPLSDTCFNLLTKLNKPCHLTQGKFFSAIQI